MNVRMFTKLSLSHCVSGSLTSSMTISAAFRTDSMTSPRARHTPTWPGDNPLRRPHGSAPDTGRERGRRARELQRERYSVVEEHGE